METEVVITLAVLGAGLLAYVIIPGFRVIWDRVLDHMVWKNKTPTEVLPYPYRFIQGTFFQQEQGREKSSPSPGLF